jgi:hypothetical protein
MGEIIAKAHKNNFKIARPLKIAGLLGQLEYVIRLIATTVT